MTTYALPHGLLWRLVAIAAVPLVQLQVPSDAEIKPLIDERLLPKTDTGFVVGVLEAGRRRIVAVGKTGSEAVPLDGATVFEIGSITKVFTASVLASMVDRGEVRLDDPVSKYLPAGVRMPAK